MRTEKPIFRGREGLGNYSAGMIGFSYRTNSVASFGIAMFTRGEYEGIIPSHAFYVVDQHKIIEATGEGVHLTDINHYFDDPHCIVFFKKPVDLTSDKIILMTDYLYDQLGNKYDYSLIFGFLLSIERWRWLRKYPSVFNSNKEHICSELVSEALYQVVEYSNLFPLSEYHPSKIDPFMLFRSEIFQEWCFDDV